MELTIFAGAMLAAVTGESIMWLVITIIIGGLVYALLEWAIKAIAIPEPFAKIARVVLILGVVVFLVNALLSVAGHGFIKW